MTIETERQLKDAAAALELSALLEKLSRVDLTAIAKRELEQRSPREKLLDKARAKARENEEILEGARVADLDKELTKFRRKARKKKKVGRPKLHWKVYKANRVKYARYVKNPTRNAKRWKLLEADTWWPRMYEMWRCKHLRANVLISKDEFLEHIQPTIGERTPRFFRYNTKGPIALDNLLVLDSDTREVLFDGKEYELRRLGAILNSS